MKIAALPAIPTESVASGAVLGVRYWHWMDTVLALACPDVRLQVDGLEGRFEGRENVFMRVAHHAGRQALQFRTELTGEFDLLGGPNGLS